MNSFKKFTEVDLCKRVSCLRTYKLFEFIFYQLNKAFKFDVKSQTLDSIVPTCSLFHDLLPSLLKLVWKELFTCCYMTIPNFLPKFSLHYQLILILIQRCLHTSMLYNLEIPLYFSWGFVADIDLPDTFQSQVYPLNHTVKIS